MLKRWPLCPDYPSSWLVWLIHLLVCWYGFLTSSLPASGLLSPQCLPQLFPQTLLVYFYLFVSLQCDNVSPCSPTWIPLEVRTNLTFSHQRYQVLWSALQLLLKRPAHYNLRVLSSLISHGMAAGIKGKRRVARFCRYPGRHLLVTHLLGVESFLSLFYLKYA